MGTDDVKQAMSVLSEYVGVAIVKLGRDGSMARAKGCDYFAPARTEFKEIDTTGAGDVFNAGFLYGYLKGWDIERCLKMGNLTGGFSIQSIGGVDDLFKKENLLDYMKDI